MTKPLNISESAAVQMPMKTVASLIILVGMGVFAYTELTSRLVSLETSRELFENDLLKKSEQVPTDQEQHFLIEDLYKTVEKIEETQEMNMTNKVNIEFLREQLDKALEDIEVWIRASLISPCTIISRATINSVISKPYHFLLLYLSVLQYLLMLYLIVLLKILC